MTCTDLPDLLPHLKLNVSRNSALLPPGLVNVQPLRWGEEGEADVQVGGPGPGRYYMGIAGIRICPWHMMWYDVIRCMGGCIMMWYDVIYMNHDAWVVAL